jgi:hypothetical protein
VQECHEAYNDQGNDEKSKNRKGREEQTLVSVKKYNKNTDFIATDKTHFLSTQIHSFYIFLRQSCPSA